jgi:hypothetical protein
LQDRVCKESESKDTCNGHNNHIGVGSAKSCPKEEQYKPYIVIASAAKPFLPVYASPVVTSTDYSVFLFLCVIFLNLLGAVDE